MIITIIFLSEMGWRFRTTVPYELKHDEHHELIGRFPQLKESKGTQEELFFQQKESVLESLREDLLEAA